MMSCNCIMFILHWFIMIYPKTLRKTLRVYLYYVSTKSFSIVFIARNIL